MRSGKIGARVVARSSVVSSNVSLKKKPKIVSIHSRSSRGVGGGGEERATASHEEEEEQVDQEEQVEQEEHIEQEEHVEQEVQ